MSRSGGQGIPVPENEERPEPSRSPPSYGRVMVTVPQEKLEAILDCVQRGTHPQVTFCANYDAMKTKAMDIMEGELNSIADIVNAVMP